MNIREAMELAIKYEKKIRDIYAAASKETRNPDSSQLLMDLARDEDNHFRYLTDSLKLWMETGQLQIDALSSSIDYAKAKESISKVRGKLPAPVANDTREERLRFWIGLYEIEKETFDFYTQAAKELDVHERKFFDRFVAVENKHLNLIQAKITSLQSG